MGNKSGKGKKGKSSKALIKKKKIIETNNFVNSIPGDLKGFKEIQKIENVFPDLIKNPKTENEIITIVVNAATDLWKIEKRLKTLENKLDDSDYLFLRRPLESALQKIKQEGILIKDRIGEIYNIGMDEHVLAFEERAGSDKEVIVETIKPTIFYREQLISKGDVIVGTPLQIKIDDINKEENNANNY